MSDIERDDEEIRDPKVDSNQGAPRLRIPPSRMPGLAKFLMSIRTGAQGVQKSAGKHHHMGSEYDPIHDQYVVYFTGAGKPVTYLVKEYVLKESKK